MKACKRTCKGWAVNTDRLLIRYSYDRIFVLLRTPDMKRVRLYTQRYGKKFIFADGDFTAVAAAIVIRPDGGGAFVLRDEVVGVATQVVRAIATGDIGWPAAPTRQHSRVRGLNTHCVAACSVVTQPLRVLPMPVPSSARDSRGALERHLEGPGMDEFAVGEFVH